MTTRIHVNGTILRENKKNAKGKRKPVFTVKKGTSNRKGNIVDIHGRSMLVYRPEHPIESGGYIVDAWIETEADVDVYS